MSYITSCKGCKHFLNTDELVDREIMICLPAWATGACEFHNMRPVGDRSTCRNHEYPVIKERVKLISEKSCSGKHLDLAEIAYDFCNKTECANCPIMTENCEKVADDCYINLVFWMRGLEERKK